jgi:diguanylate cyclase (GGDEF)-like protein
MGLLSQLYERTRGSYAGADIALARRFTTFLWALGILVVAILNLFFPPTRNLGDAGWAVAGATYVIALVIMWLMADARRNVGYDFLHWTGFLGVLLIAASEYGADGPPPYHQLYMFLLIGAALMHPARRVLALLLFISAAVFVRAVYAPGTTRLGEIATELFTWTVLAVVLIILMRTIRSQRIALRREGDDARELARVDALTGLGNRRAFDEALEAELARARRTGSPLSLLVADLDGFKKINDRHGHSRGDECLRKAADALRATLRAPDQCFRWGGDEFTILLVAADEPAAARLAVRVQKAVARACSRPGGGSLTITCGHAALDADMSADEAVERADEALMALKSHARVATASHGGPLSRPAR